MNHRRQIIQLLVVTFLIFGNSLLNGFVGDDNFLLLNNSFYTSWSNAKDLFTSEYTTHATGAIGLQDTKQYYSGSVAYRPVLSITYFFDYWVWKLNPFGYHLTNLLWHAANVMGVYFIFWILCKNSLMALFGAIIFSIHPFKSEAVCSIGYRADLVSTFFLIVSFLLYIFYSQSRKQQGRLLLSYLAFGLAIFAKESVIVYPAVLVVYDRLFNGYSFKELFRNESIRRYSGYIIIALGYLYTYLYVFPNRTIGGTGLFGGNWASHLCTLVYILGDYLKGFFAPFGVNILPPVYVPPIKPIMSSHTILMFVWVLVSILILWRTSRGNTKAVFFLAWFLISLIPVSNIIPLVNPMAYRFLYLPSIGISFVLALMIIKLGEWLNQKTNANHFVNIFLVGYIAFCAARVIPLNSFWRNDLIMAYRMYVSKPEYPTSLLFMGITYSKLNNIADAREMALKALDNGLEDPRAYYILGKSEKGDHDSAKYYLIKGLNEYPSYGMLYTGLGRILLLELELDKAESYLRVGTELAPTYRGYCYLVQYHLMMGDEAAAREVLKSAKKDLTDPKFYKFIENIIENRNSIALPQDIGF